MSAPVNHALDAALDALSTSMSLTDDDRADVAQVVTAVEEFIVNSGFTLSDERRLGLCAHSLAFTRRLKSGETLPEIDINDFPEIPETTVSGLRGALAPYSEKYRSELGLDELFLFAMHVEVARLTP